MKNLKNSEIKVSNKAKIANFIYKKNETSKQEIVKELGISNPTVLQNVKELIEEGIVEEVGKYQSTGGRKAKVLAIVRDKNYSIGVDITKNHINIVLLDMKAIMINSNRIRIKYSDSIEYYKSIGGYIDKFIFDNNIEEDKILGVGISIPGIIDEKNLLLVRSHILEVKNISLKNFEKFINYNICFDNDANSAAYAEISSYKKDAVYLSINDTVGGAIYIDRSIYMGETFKSAEFGHMIIEKGGRTCYCGKNGCVNAYCSAKVLSKYSDDDLELFFEMTRNGDKKYLEILEKYLEYLSITITNLRMIFDCDIVIGGYIGGFLDEYRLQLDKSITKYNNFDMDTSYIYTGKYKKEASAIGIAMKFIDRFFYELI